MRDLNYEFFEEFKKLDNLCRDIYGKSSDNKLGVTSYIEDMEKKARQGVNITDWNSDYRRLKSARHIRNQLAHDNVSFSSDLCTQSDVDFIRSFRSRILNQTDPISVLRNRAVPNRTVYQSNGSYRRPYYSGYSSRRTSTGCLALLLWSLGALACTVFLGTIIWYNAAIMMG